MKAPTKTILRIERIKRGWTQEDVAKMLNMARGSYAKYETGANIPTTENIIKLAEIYRLSTDYLLGVDFKTAMKTNFEQGIDDGVETGEQLKNRVRKPKNKT